MATPEERHPEVFRPLNRESPRDKKRIVPMQCLNLSLNRTGSVTMNAALNILGINCWHSTALFADKFGHVEMWEEAVDNKFFGKGPKFGRDEFDKLFFDNAGVSADTPAVAFADDLIEAYPEAKVVLIEREIESWYKSFMNGVINQMVSGCSNLKCQANSNVLQWNPFTILIYYLDPFYIRPYGRLSYKVMDGWLGIRSKADAVRQCKPRYREHYALVRRLTPPDRLLEFKLSDGWEPLCEFLDKPVPDVPFPHLNEQAWIHEKVHLMLMKGLKGLAWKMAVYGVPVATAAGLAYYWSA